MRNILLTILIFIPNCIFSQNSIAIGQWRSHQDYTKTFKVIQVGDTIFAAGKTGLFYYIRSSEVVTPLSKVNGFSDIDISAMGYSTKYHILFVGYNNTLVDMLHSNKISSYQDVYRFSGILGAKTINGFYFNDKYCYLATTFGIIKYDIERNETAENYEYIWPSGSVSPAPASIVNVKSIAFFNDSIYAATDHGLIGAPNDGKYLGNYANWKLILPNTDCNQLQVIGNRLWVLFNTNTKCLKYYDKNTWHSFMDSTIQVVNSIETDSRHLVISTGHSCIVADTLLQATTYTFGAQDIIMDENEDFWLAPGNFGLIKGNKAGNLSFHCPNGPYSSSNAMIYNYKDEIYVASGGVDLHYNPYYSNNGVYVFKNGYWDNQNYVTGRPWWGQGFKDVYSIAADPLSGRKYYGSFGFGVMSYDNNQVYDTFGMYNSPLRPPSGFGDTIPLWHGSGSIKIGGVAFDNDGTLWISNFLAKTPLIARKNNKFYTYEITHSPERKDFLSITPDDYGQLWIRRAFTGGVLIYDYVNKKVKELSTSKGSGNLPDNNVNCIVKDKDGFIWVGTNNGVTLFSNPQNMAICTTSQCDGIPPWVENGKESGYLLNLQIITAIAVDGANRKWIGTKKGVFVCSSDGTKILYNFTAKNSPLLSDNVQCIGINGVSGEVFIGTDLGVVSYRANAIEATDDFTDVYAFPNPVRPGYTGPIAIRGLTDNTNIKITDVTGNLVYETTSHGGLVTWDGRNFSGQLANSGVYLVLMSNEDGSKTKTTKILIVR